MMLDISEDSIQFSKNDNDHIYSIAGNIDGSMWSKQDRDDIRGFLEYKRRELAAYLTEARGRRSGTKTDYTRTAVREKKIVGKILPGSRRFDQNLAYPSDGVGQYMEVSGEVVSVGVHTIQVETSDGMVTAARIATAAHNLAVEAGDKAVVRLYNSGGAFYPDNILVSVTKKKKESA